MKYAIISDSYFPRFEDHKDFHILIHGLTKEQILSIIKAYKNWTKSENYHTVHPIEARIKVEGFEYEFSGDTLQEFYFGKIIPMWTFDEFEEENAESTKND